MFLSTLIPREEVTMNEQSHVPTSTSTIVDVGASEYTERTVTLPDGRTVTVSLDPSTWPKVGEYGFIPEEAVVPDPDNPRNTAGIINTNDHAEFAESIARHGQAMIMKVRLLSEAELEQYRKEYSDVRYMVVDGERRFHASGKKGANLGVYEVTVQRFDDPRARFLHQVVVNRQQLPLDVPDLSLALERIQREWEESAAGVARMTGMNQVAVNQLLAIARLPEDLRELTSREHYKKNDPRKLPLEVAFKLARVEAGDGMTADERQRYIVAQIAERKIRGAKQRVAFVETFLSEEVLRHSERRQPKRRRARFMSLADSVNNSDLPAIPEDELEQALSTANEKELEDLAEALLKASDRLRKMALRVKHYARTHSGDPKDEQAKSDSPPAEEVEPKSVTEAPQAAPREREVPTIPASSPPPKERPAPPVPVEVEGGPHTPSFPIENVMYFDQASGRMTMGTVRSADQFIKIWEGGNFKHQKDGRPPPSNLPDVGKVRAIMTNGGK